jgi:radical SAM superfamily enzyme YgiQ (UPF0313 family)
MLLSNELKKHGHLTNLLKYDFKNDNKIISEVKKLKPNILAYSIMTGEHTSFINLNNNISKEYDVLNIWGGAHCSFFPEIINESGASVVFRGEAEEILPEFCDKYGKDRVIPTDVKGTIVKINDKIIENPLQILPENLDSFEADRELLYKYPEHLNNPVRNFLGCRGCIYNCSFCFNSTYNCIFNKSKRIRCKNPELYIEEIKKTIREWPTQLIYFQDDNLLNDRKYFEKLMKLYKEKIKLPFHCHFNVNSAYDDAYKILKEAKCLSVTFSPECGDQSVRYNLLNKKTSDKKIIEVARNLHKYGIKFRTENILALPMENSLQNDYETYRFNKKLKANVPWVSLYIPYPRTKMGQYCINNGYFDIKNINNLPKTFFGESPLNKLKYKNYQQRLQKIFMIGVYYSIPLWIIKILIKLPLEKFYSWLYKKYKKYLYDVKLYGIK